MIRPPLLCALGLPVGELLLGKVPTCPRSEPPSGASLSVIIPARNEERNLPRLLHSISQSDARPRQVLVVDDGSSDGTAAVAARHGACVLASAAKPSGWTGKSWACYQGAQLVAGGLDRMQSCWLRERDPRLVLSILPYHAMHAAYEQLSLIFNLLMAAGAGGFGPFGTPQLFGQSLLIARSLYFEAGGHAAVPGVILENLRWTGKLRASGARIQCFGGRATLHMRMFPDGFRQMSESWAKAFTQGAEDSGPLVLATSTLWICALWSTILLAFNHGYRTWALLIVYVLLALQIAFMARRLGSYRLLTSFLFPFPLAYFCAVFGRATARRVLGRKTNWRGREV